MVAMFMRDEDPLGFTQLLLNTTGVRWCVDEPESIRIDDLERSPNEGDAVEAEPAKTPAAGFVDSATIETLTFVGSASFDATASVRIPAKSKPRRDSLGTGVGDSRQPKPRAATMKNPIPSQPSRSRRSLDLHAIAIWMLDDRGPDIWPDVDPFDQPATALFELCNRDIEIGRVLQHESEVIDSAFRADVECEDV